MTSLTGTAAVGVGRTQLPVPDVCDLPGLPSVACDVGGAVLPEVATSAMEKLAGEFVEGFAQVARVVLTWWTAFPSPELTTAGGGPGTVLADIRGYTTELQVLLLTAGVLFAAARLALAKRGGVAGEAQETFVMLVRAVFASMLFAAVITAGTRAGDEFSNWVIFTSTRGDFDGAMKRLTEIQMTTGSAGLGTISIGVMLVLALLGIISMLVQLVMLVTRQVLLIVTVAVIPLAAAASGTGPGSQSYKKLLSWSLAFVLWKPVGALVYAIAFTAAGRSEDPHLILLGLLLMILSVIVLPALIRLVAPAVSVLGGGGGAAAAFAGGAVGIAMSSTGSRSNGRKVTEGENSPGRTQSGGSAPGPSGGGGGGGRPIGDGGGSGGPGSGGGRAGGGGGSGGAPPSAGTTGGARSGSGAKAPGAQRAGTAGSAGGAGGASAGAGAAGAAVMAAQAATDAAQRGVSAIDSHTRDAAADQWDPNALGPGEVRR
ncbi:hypothetical protein [Nocardia sputi]|uniref:hypothetical protein n=1 Tax=Nocardia sputi TaxID=2943705 RepID=UPI0020BF5AED|nr:hypothetical protein [Nocardia sputi]